MPQAKQIELGCYGDGALGHQHTRDRCADVLEHYAQENFSSRGKTPPLSEFNDRPHELVRYLRAEMSDDAGEEDSACGWLNEHVPFTAAYWGWDNGDFGLWQEEPDESAS